MDVFTAFGAPCWQSLQFLEFNQVGWTSTRFGLAYSRIDAKRSCHARELGKYPRNVETEAEERKDENHVEQTVPESGVSVELVQSGVLETVKSQTE